MIRYLLGLIILIGMVPAAKAEALRCQQLLSSIRLHAEDIRTVGEFNLILSELKKSAEFSKNLQEYNEESKRITIEEHSRDVFRQYAHEINSRPISPELIKLLPLTVALHDIGKPLAIAAGNRAEQHKYTLPIVEKLLREQNFRELDIARIKAIISFAGIGELLKGEKDSYSVMLEINKLAFSLRLTPWDFYVAKRAFFLSDAGSYSQLRRLIFIEVEKGRLDAKGTALSDLEFWLVGQKF